MVGTNWACGDPVPLDQFEALSGVEPLHHHDCGPQPLAGHGRHQRRGVVQGRGREVHRALRHSVAGDYAGNLGGWVRRIAERSQRQRLPHPFRPPRRPRRVQHLTPFALVGERFGGDLCDGILVASKPWKVAHRADPDLVSETRSRPATTSAIASDPTKAEAPQSSRMYWTSRWAQMRVYCGVVEPRPLGCPGHLQVEPVVLHHDGDASARTEAAVTEDPSQARRSVLELGEATRLRAQAHDDGRTIGPLFGLPPQRRFEGHSGDRRCHITLFGRKTPAVPTGDAFLGGRLAAGLRVSERSTAAGTSRSSTLTMVARRCPFRPGGLADTPPGDGGGGITAGPSPPRATSFRQRVLVWLLLSQLLWRNDPDAASSHIRSWLQPAPMSYPAVRVSDPRTGGATK